MTFAQISGRSQDQLRFYLGWASLVLAAGVSLLVQQASDNIYIALSVFFIGFGISLILIGVSTPMLPLVLLSGSALVLIGFLILGIFVVLLNAIILIGVVIVAVSGGVIWFYVKKGDWK